MPKKNNPSEFNREREFAVILEDVNKNVKTLAEGHSLLNDKLDAISGKVTIVYEELGRQRGEIVFIKTDIKFIKEDVKELKTGLNELNGKFDLFSQSFDKRVTKLEASSR